MYFVSPCIAQYPRRVNQIDKLLGTAGSLNRDITKGAAGNWKISRKFEVNVVLVFVEWDSITGSKCVKMDWQKQQQSY